MPWCTSCLILALSALAAGDEFRALSTEREQQYLRVAFSPGGEFIAATGNVHRAKNGQVTIWNVHSGEVVAWTNDFPTACASLDFSPDGSLLAAACGDRSIHVFRKELVRRRVVWRRIARLPRQRESGDRLIVPDEVRFSPDGRILACSMYGPDRGNSPMFVSRGVQIWKSGSFVAPEKVLMHAGAPARILRFLDERGDRLLIAHAGTTSGRSLSIIDVRDNSTETELPIAEIDDADAETGGGDLPNCVDVSADFGQVALGGRSVLVVLSAETLEVERALAGHEEEGGTFVAFVPESRILASCGGDVIHLWDLESGELLCSREYPEVCQIAASPDGSKLATNSYTDQSVRIWDIRQMLEDDDTSQPE